MESSKNGERKSSRASSPYIPHFPDKLIVGLSLQPVSARTLAYVYFYSFCPCLTNLSKILIITTPEHLSNTTLDCCLRCSTFLSPLHFLSPVFFTLSTYGYPKFRNPAAC